MSETPSVSSRLYSTIVADPPWDYPEGFGAVGTNHLIRGRKRTFEEQGPLTKKPLPYATMTLRQIAALPLRELADDDCRLFLWTTNRYLPMALDICADWGFSYRQLLIWDKTPTFNPLSGSVASQATEFVIVSIRGKPARLAKAKSNIIRGRKPRTAHSRKPDAFLDLVEEVSPGPYLELFARRQRLGWDTWGNEALEHVEVVA